MQPENVFFLHKPDICSLNERDNHIKEYVFYINIECTKELLSVVIETKNSRMDF